MRRNCFGDENMFAGAGVGFDDFRVFREQGYWFVDKSMFIQEFLTAGEFVTLITRPRRFGKTLNMSMVREFFDCTLESHDIFEGLRITTTKCMQYMNSLPVIYLSFKDCRGSKEVILAQMQRILQQEYERFLPWLEQLPRFEKSAAGRVYSSLENCSLTMNSLSSAIYALCDAVFKTFKARPLVLIDEYDTPISAAYAAGCFDDLRSFFGIFYGSAFKGNPFVSKVLLTGVQRVAKDSIFSGLNNLSVYTVLSQKYSEYFGFTESEVLDLLDRAQIPFSEEIKNYYNGYCFGGVEVYCPWSVASFLSQKELLPFWSHSASSDVILKYASEVGESFLRDVDRLIMTGQVTVTVNNFTAFSESANSATLWGLLLNAGYVTSVPEDTRRGTFRTIRIPNYEVSRDFGILIEQRVKISFNSLDALFSALIMKRDFRAFVNIYTNIVIELMSFHDVRENSYHMLLLGMCAVLHKLYEVHSNREHGLGRSDIRLRSLSSRNPHIIIEFKYGSNLKGLAKDALQQIKDKKYFSGLEGEVILLGLAHYGKECCAQVEVGDVSGLNFRVRDTFSSFDDQDADKSFLTSLNW